MISAPTIPKRVHGPLSVAIHRVYQLQNDHGLGRDELGAAALEVVEAAADGEADECHINRVTGAAWKSRSVDQKLETKKVDAVIRSE
jgi:hypothetical protein